MRVGVFILKIDYFFLILRALKPGIRASPHGTRIRHDAQAVIADDKDRRQIKIIGIFHRLVKYAGLRGHVPAEKVHPPFLILAL